MNACETFLVKKKEKKKKETSTQTQNYINMREIERKGVFEIISNLKVNDLLGSFSSSTHVIFVIEFHIHLPFIGRI